MPRLRTSKRVAIYTTDRLRSLGLRHSAHYRARLGAAARHDERDPDRLRREARMARLIQVLEELTQGLAPLGRLSAKEADLVRQAVDLFVTDAEDGRIPYPETADPSVAFDPDCPDREAA